MKVNKPERIRFVFEKARHHRTVHADGAWATTTPQGEIQFAFFSDLRPMPQQVVHSVTTDGVLGEELSRQQHAQDVTREASVTVVMNKETVKKLIELLGGVVKQMEDQIAAAEDRRSIEVSGQDLEVS